MGTNASFQKKKKKKKKKKNQKNINKYSSNPELLVLSNPFRKLLARISFKLDNMDAHSQQQQQHADNTTEVPNDPGKMFIGGLSWQTSAEGLGNISASSVTSPK